MNQQKHIPVLKGEILNALKPKEKQKYLDLTAGYGGHAGAVIGKLGKDGLAVLVDRDQVAIKHLEAKFSNFSGVQIIHSDFLSASRQLQREGKKFDMVFADLGVSSLHLNSARRGFSFMREGPLDMRMDNRQELSASDIINKFDEAELTDILRKYGEIRGAHKLAKKIIENRPYSTTTQLATIIARGRRGYQKTHPATQAFQAIRIAVNDELSQLSEALSIWLELLTPNGRLAVISFHSLEDRIVKRFFIEHGKNKYSSELKILTKKPIIATKDEIVNNPRSRSAKLRVAVKIKT